MSITNRTPESTAAAVHEAENASVGFERVVEQIAKRVGAHSHAASVFGEPITRDGVTVIPVARVIGGFGAGAIDPAPKPDAAEGSSRAGSIGGGGGFLATPVGLIEIRPEGARFRRMDPPLGAWGDVAELLLFVARRGFTSLAQALRKDD